MAVAAMRRNDSGAHAGHLDQLHGRATGPGGTKALSTALVGALLRAVKACWDHGWQPADLIHSMGRRFGSAQRRLCAEMVVLESRSYAGAVGADPEWLAQLPTSTADADARNPSACVDRWAAPPATCARPSARP